MADATLEPEIATDAMSHATPHASRVTGLSSRATREPARATRDPSHATQEPSRCGIERRRRGKLAKSPATLGPNGSGGGCRGAAVLGSGKRSLQPRVLKVPLPQDHIDAFADCIRTGEHESVFVEDASVGNEFTNQRFAVNLLRQDGDV